MPLTIPAIYRAPYGIPLYWRDEQSGTLSDAVAKYFEHVLGTGPAPTDEEIALLWEYINHHINAPAWTRTCAGSYDEELAALRRLAQKRGGIPELRAYVIAAMEIALEPF